MTYDFDGKKYETAAVHQREWGERLIEGIDLQGTERILDLGCGDGTLTVQLSRLVPIGVVIGVDASPGMLEAAKPKELSNLAFLLMDINKLDFDQEFDVIFSNATLHWIYDHQGLIINIQRALRHGGVARLNFAGDGNCSHFFNVIRESMARPEFSKYFENFIWPWYMPSVEEYRELLNNGCFNNIKVWGENSDRFFPDEESLINWIDEPSLVPFISCVAEPDRILFREYVVRRMIEETIQSDGRFFETFRRINVIARKDPMR